MEDLLKKQSHAMADALEKMTDEEIDILLKEEGKKIRHLCHGYKSIEISPLVFHYALQQRINESDDLMGKLKKSY